MRLNTVTITGADDRIPVEAMMKLGGPTVDTTRQPLMTCWDAGELRRLLAHALASLKVKP